MEAITITALAVVIVAVLWLISNLRDVRKVVWSMGTGAEPVKKRLSSALMGTSKEYGIYLLYHGIWRRNRRNNKVK